MSIIHSELNYITLLFHWHTFILYKEILTKLTINMNYYNNVKHLITQTHILVDVNYEIESTVIFDGLKMSLITFCKRDPQMTFVPTLHIILVINSYGNHNKIVLQSYLHLTH